MTTPLPPRFLLSLSLHLSSLETCRYNLKLPLSPFLRFLISPSGPVLGRAIDNSPPLSLCFIFVPQAQYKAETAMDKLNGILTNINAALDKFQVGSGPLAGKSIASATQGLNFMEVGGREGRRRCLELQGAEEDGGWGLQAEPCGLGMRV